MSAEEMSREESVWLTTMSAAREFVCFLVSAPVIPFSVYMPIRERDVKIAIEMSKAVREKRG